MTADAVAGHAGLRVETATYILDLKRGDPAPPIVAVTTDGKSVDLAGLRGRTVVLLFAEAQGGAAGGHDRSREAVRHIAQALMQEGIGGGDGQPVSWLIVYTKGSDTSAIRSEAAAIHASIPHAMILHDVERHAFGTYQAVAIPSTVVIDGRGRIVHVMAGLSPRFPHIVSDALLLAAGRMTAEQFEVTLNGVAEQRNEAQRRAERLAQMARRLSERGQYELAESNYIDALALAPEMIHARLGLADLLLRTGRLDEAETGFRSVLDASPKSMEAAAGLALVYALRGDVDEAENLARDVLDRSPSRARPHYVLGLVHETRGQHAEAARSYRRAAELLLDRSEPDDPAHGDPTSYP